MTAAVRITRNRTPGDITGWRDHELQFLRANWLTMPTPEIAKHLGRTVGSVIGKADRIGLPRLPRSVAASRGAATRAKQKLAGMYANPRNQHTKRKLIQVVGMDEDDAICRYLDSIPKRGKW